MSVLVSYSGQWLPLLLVSSDADSLAEIDILSTSSIHQGCPHVDFSLKINVDNSRTDS